MKNLVCVGSLLFFVSFISGCGPKESDIDRIQWFTMGTIAAVQSTDSDTLPKARDVSQTIYEAIEKRFSAWNDASELAVVNASAGNGKPCAVSDEFFTLATNAWAFCRASDGAFNPLVGSIMKVWGFNGAKTVLHLPTSEALEQAVALADWHKVVWTNQTVLLPDPGMKLDFGAIAKGYAVDVVFEKLRSAGYTNLLVDLGGNLRATGEAAPRRGGWRVGIRDPFKKYGILATFLLKPGEATATSGNYERFVTIEGQRYAHIMDARHAMPVRGMAGVTVVAPTALLADGLSTTLFVLGPNAGAKLLKNYPGCDAVWIPDASGKVILLATANMAKRINPIGKTDFTLSVVNP